jgi:predicted dehydrogenase
MKKIRFGLVGCGKIASCNHAPEVAALGSRRAEIVALYDRVKGKARTFAEQQRLPHARVCDSYAALLASDIDAVIIATPNSFHCPQTLEALRAGKHVLVEKPMAGTVAEADRMINLALRKRLVLQVNQSLRFAPLYVEIARRVAAGAIGKPMHARCLRASANSPDVAWSPGATWFVQKRYEGSLVGDIAVHMADFLQCAFGPVRRVHAITRNWTHEVEDNVTALFDFENGATGVLQLSWTFPQGDGALELYGNQGKLCTNKEGFLITYKDSAKPPLQVRHDACKPLPDSHAAFVRRLAAGAPDAWVAGREALALCEAIRVANRTGAAARPKNRATRA